MCKVIIAGNQKGGVAKTTTVANLGIGLARHGKRVLLIDGDAQGSLTASLGYRKRVMFTTSLYKNMFLRKRLYDIITASGVCLKAVAIAFLLSVFSAKLIHQALRRKPIF